MKELLKKLGLTQTEIEQAMAETPPEGFSIDEIVNRISDHTIQVYEGANPRLSEADVQGKVIAAQKDIKHKVAQLLGISETRGNIEKMTTDDFLKIAKEKKEEITSRFEGDEKLKSKLDETTQKLIAVNQELEIEKENKELELTKIRNESINSVKKFKLDAMIKDYANLVDWGIPPAAIPAQIIQLKTKIEEQDWTVNDDGTLSGANGTGLAISFDKKGSFKSIKEVVDKEFEPLTKKSTGQNGQANAPVHIVAGVNSETVKSASNKETLTFLEGK